MAHFFELPPFENEDENSKARLTFLISAGMIVASLTFTAVSLFALPALLQRTLVLAAIAVLPTLIILWMLRSLKLQAASLLLVGTVWLVVTVGCIIGGGTSAPLFLGYLFVITLSSLLMARRASMGVMGLCVVTALSITAAEVSGFLPTSPNYSPIERVSLYVLFFVIALELQNITARNISRLLHQARESESKYKSFLESIPTITYMDSPGLEAETQYVSPQVKELLGYSQDEFIRDPLLWQKIIHPEDRERVLLENTFAVQTGYPFHVEYRLLAEDQHVVWVSDEAILVRDQHGEPHYWLGVWTDITMRKRAEEEQNELISVMTKRTIQLQTAAEVSRAASSILDINTLLPNVVELIRNHFEYYYVGIFLVDESRNWAVLKAATGEMGQQMIHSGHRLPVGDSSMIGWCISHGQARIALDVGADAVRLRNPYLPLTRSEMALPLIAHGDVIGAMTIQSELPAAFSNVDITALQTMADQVANAIENARLFTERSTLINELEKRNAELERFTYTVSHDLRSPLVTIHGFLGYLRQSALSGNMTRFDNDLHRIGNAVDKMQALLSDLLELSRVGHVINMLDDVPFRRIVDETLDLLSGPLGTRRIHVQVEDHLPTIHGDPIRLVEIMQNLVSNAVKFMGAQPEPRIEIGTRGFDEEGKTILFVSDNGIGIEPEYHERIFGLFNRLNPEIEGTGIGLTLVRRIVEVHGGRIWVESIPGHGSTFLFTLPRSGA